MVAALQLIRRATSLCPSASTCCCRRSRKPSETCSSVIAHLPAPAYRGRTYDGRLGLIDDDLVLILTPRHGGAVLTHVIVALQCLQPAPPRAHRGKPRRHRPP